MAEKITEKIIQSGDVIEFYDYKEGYLKGYQDSVRGPRRDREEITIKEQLENRKSKLNSKKKRLKRLIHANKDNLKRFVTLTFEEDVTDMNVAKKRLDRFKDKIRYNYRSFKYIIVFNYQENGRLHFHILWDLPYIEQDELVELWGNGTVYVDKPENIANYMANHINEELVRPEFIDNKTYFSSKGLKKPQEYTNEDALDILWDLKMSRNGPVFTTKFENDYLGEINYEKYWEDSG